MLTAELDAGRLAHVLQAFGPRLVVLTGRRQWLDALGRIGYQTRRSPPGRQVEILDFRGALADADAAAVARLGTSAVGARDLVLARLNARDAAVRSRPALAQIS
jgi:hypothetical protein